MKTYTANIYLGLREGYDGSTHSINEVKDILRKEVNRIGLCVTVTPTTFIYKNGFEDGVIIGLINYPRFPKEESEIKEIALELASILGKNMGQKRVSVVCSDETIMLGEKE